MPPSFNDIRLILNSAQMLGLVRGGGRPELVTFDGDLTLYGVYMEVLLKELLSYDLVVGSTDS